MEVCRVPKGPPGGAGARTRTSPPPPLWWGFRDVCIAIELLLYGYGTSAPLIYSI
jgi:hypothetical protein